MATGVQVWSQTAATNATADGNVNYAEGQAPSSLNDSSRAAMASVAKYRDDQTGTNVTAGTSLAFTLVTNQVATALTSGYTVSFQFSKAAGVGATLAVDGLTAKPLQVNLGTNLLGGEYASGSIGRFTYSTTGTGQWYAVDGGSAPVVPSARFPIFTTASNSLVGDVSMTTTSFFDGPSVSQGTSGGFLASGAVTVLAGANTSSVIAKLWDGTTVIASGNYTIVASGAGIFSLSGLITAPVGNIKISVARQAGIANTTIKANSSGIGNTDSTLTVVRLA